ncbi:ABC transporter permease [Parapusillimonas granuli]|uniref:ABC transporter permease n=1 Tax=Parapusillimonas granuli TaxID=380911 RepID=A0A853G5N7_9BURK|nr:ABC transporter permease [Parapusillimonas granuli]NYT51092.1 ABC transporter permease [Parapusillimonas granuli]
MLSYTLRRLLMTLPVMLFVALFVFGLLDLAPGDPAALLAGEDATQQDIARIRDTLGLDKPFLLRFGEWLWAIAHGDLGTSLFTGLPVSAMIAQRLAPTVTLMIMTLIVSVVVAIPFGALAAWMHNRWHDRGIMVLAVLSFSVPSFVVGYLLAWTLGLQLRWFPVQGYVPFSQGVGASLHSLVLPALALGSVYIALITRITRATLLETLSQDYVRTARAKGVSNRSILFLHALKNAAVPIVTIIASGVALLISGTVVTETVFAIPGLGRLTVDAILRRDYPIIQGVILLFSFSYVLINLAADLLYRVFDPRIHY